MNFGKIGKKEREVRNRMPKILSLSLEDEDLLCELAASLSSRRAYRRSNFFILTVTASEKSLKN